MFLFATTLLMMAAGAGFGSCAQNDGVLNTHDSQQTAVKEKAHVKLSIFPTLSVSSSTMQSSKAYSSSILTRAALTAEGKALTDLFIFDYDKVPLMMARATRRPFQIVYPAKETKP